MITLFTTPKPFKGLNAIIQRNAIQSWLKLRPKCEIILLGDDEGTADIACEFGLCHIPVIDRNDHGTPLVNSLFELAQQASNNEIICYINADIILLSDFIHAVKRIPLKHFLMVGQRWDVDINYKWDFDSLEWETQIREYVNKHGKIHSPTGIDYFLHSRGLFSNIPPFAIGRIVWDNWLIYTVRSHKVPVIDVTQEVMAIHQNHDWSHSPDGRKGIWEGVEAKNNLELAGGSDHIFTLWDATHKLTPNGMKVNFSATGIVRKLITLPILHHKLRCFLYLSRLSFILIRVFQIIIEKISKYKRRIQQYE